jgi:hypothetical protein
MLQKGVHHVNKDGPVLCEEQVDFCITLEWVAMAGKDQKKEGEERVMADLALDKAKEQEVSVMQPRMLKQEGQAIEYNQDSA